MATTEPIGPVVNWRIICSTLALSNGAVIESTDTAVRFDFNHPLAGQPVTFEVKLIGVL